MPPSRADRRLAAAVGLQLRAYARHSSLADSSAVRRFEEEGDALEDDMGDAMVEEDDELVDVLNLFNEARAVVYILVHLLGTCNFNEFRVASIWSTRRALLGGVFPRP